ncbi:MAG: hypothetical protein GY832_10470 [Chloroflexi bacterium]|nr:hypothetical protein [Chloroflexota bacterium]
MQKHTKRWLNLLVVLTILFGITNVAIGAQPALETPSTTTVQPQDPPQDPIQRLMDATGGTARVSTNGATGMVQFVHLEPASLPFNMKSPTESTARAQAMSFLETHGAAFGVKDPQRELELVKVESDYIGAMHVSYEQVYEGVSVFGAVLRVHFDAQGQLLAVNGTFVPDVDLNTTPALDADAAAAVAVAKVAGKVSAFNSTLYVFRANLARDIPGDNHLVYEVEVGNGDDVREFVYVDAHSGKIVDQITGIYDNIYRRAFDSRTNYPNTPFWLEGDALPTGNAEADNVIYGSGEMYNLMASLTGGTYLSFDGNDAVMDVIFNRTESCPNASWNGNDSSFCPGVTGGDTVAHEWGHAYTQYTHNLIYQWQQGALNESYSDVWGETSDLYNVRGLSTDHDDLRTDGACSQYSDPPGTDDSYRWLSGEDDTGFGGAIRDMWNPNCISGDPGKVSDPGYVCSSIDGGGVHTNSGVPNHGFALLTDGGTYNGETVTGIGITKTAPIYWRAQMVYQVPTTDFADHADALEQSCQDLIGQPLWELSTAISNTVIASDVITTTDCDQIATMIDAVELRLEPTQCNFQTMFDLDAPPLCEALATPVSVHSQDWESGVGAWTVGARQVLNPDAFIMLNWHLTDTLPFARPGLAVFAEDADKGSCDSPADQSSVRYLESPDVIIPAGAAAPLLAFDHSVSTEIQYDGGNVKISVNGGGWQLVPDSAFTFNGYIGTLLDTNPLDGEGGFYGSDAGAVVSKWGQSQVDLSGLANPGDTIKLRFEMGIDGCGGVVGWYVDEVEIYHCEAQPSGTLQGTVINSSTSNPVVGALVEAEMNPVFTTTTGIDGSYSMPVIVGTYTVTVSTFAYTTTVTSGVVVAEDGTTVQDVSLDPMAGYVVSGTVTDVNTDWPLYANVAISGYLGAGDWTDPETGYYSITLPAGVSYTLNVDAWVDGYLPDSRDVNLTSDQTEDFALVADPDSCNAPGYVGGGGDVIQDGGFELGTPNPHWTEYSQNGWDLIAMDNPRTGSYSVWQGGDTDEITELTQTLTIPNGTATLSFWLVIGVEGSGSDADDWMTVDIDGNQLFSITGADGASYGDYTEVTIDVSAYADGGSHVLHFNSSNDAATYSNFFVDDVALIVAGNCTAPSGGGLVVGNVYDDNTGDGVNGAAVENEDSYAATTVASPDDLYVDDGFYTLFSPAGSRTFTATMDNYSDDIAPPTVVQSDTIRQDFNLTAGMLSYVLDSYDVTLELGASTTQAFTLTNSGGEPVEFEFLETPGEFVPSRMMAKPTPSRHVGLSQLSALQSIAKTTHAPTAAAPRKINAVLWDQPRDVSGNGIVSDFYTNSGLGTYSADDFGIVGEIWSIDTIFVDGFINDVALDSATDLNWYIYPDAGGEPDGYPGDGMETWSFSAAPTDAAITIVDDSPTLDIVAAQGQALELPAGTYWLSFFPSMNITSGSDRFNWFKASTTTGDWAALYDEGNFGSAAPWTDITVLLADSTWHDTAFRLEGTAEATDVVPWLAEDPITGTLASMSDLPVTLTFDAAEVDQPGEYHAELLIVHDTPYDDVDNLPVTLTVTAPATWGKLEGTVYSLGHCDVNTVTLEGATVQIDDGSVVTETESNADGTYVYWLEAGTYTVTVVPDDHIMGAPVVVIVTAGGTVTLDDVYLRSDEPCISVTPLSMEADLELNQSESQTLLLTNAGAGASTFNIEEAAGALFRSPMAPTADWIDEDPTSGTVAADSSSEVTVTFTNLASISPGTYDTALVITTQDAVNDVVIVPVMITIAPRPEPVWDKLVYVNDVMTDVFPVTVYADDTIEVVDQVWITYTDNVTFTLEEDWTESLELVDFAVSALPGGTAVLPTYGTVITTTGTWDLTVTDAPSDWGYIITKTFTVLEGDWETDTITETLTVEGAYPQLSDKVLQFGYVTSEYKVYLPLVVRNSDGTAVLP